MLSLMDRALRDEIKQEKKKQATYKPAVLRKKGGYGAAGTNLKEYFIKKKQQINGVRHHAARHPASNEDLSAALDSYEAPNSTPPEPLLQASPPSEQKPSPPLSTPVAMPLASYGGIERQPALANHRNADIFPGGQPQTEDGQKVKPLLFVDIDIGEDQKDRITVLPNDNASDLAQEFCEKHGFDYETQCTLEQQLMLKIEKVKTMMRRRKADQEHDANNPFSPGTLQVVEEDEGAEEAAVTSEKDHDRDELPEEDEDMLAYGDIDPADEPFERNPIGAQLQRLTEYNEPGDDETLRKLGYAEKLDEETDDFVKTEQQLQ
jgi:hypothetical protein